MSTKNAGVAELTADTPLYRVHGDRPGSVALFRDAPDGRFNLRSTDGMGTCYLALDPLGAFIETLGRRLDRSVSEIASRRLSELTTGRPLRVLDLTQTESRARYHDRGLDLTAAYQSERDYTATQHLASLVHADQLDGIVYSASHDPSHNLLSLALFGPLGAHDTDEVFASCKTSEIPVGLISQAAVNFGFRVLADPPEE